MSSSARKSKLLDFDLMADLSDLEMQVFEVFKNFPKKYQFNIMQRVYDNLGLSENSLGHCLVIHPYSAIHVKYKRDMLENSLVNVKLVEMNFAKLNKMGILSDSKFAEFMIMFNGLIIGYSKFLGTLNKKIKSMETAENKVGKLDTGEGFSDEGFNNVVNLDF